MQKRDLVKTIVLIASIILVTVGSAVGLNFLTGPQIAKNEAVRDEIKEQAAAGVLAEVLPGSGKFDELVGTEGFVLDETSGVSSVLKDQNGKGYVIIVSKTNSPMNDVVTVTFGVDMSGLITGIKEEFASDKDYKVSADTMNSFVGKDSTLADIVITGGATVSSSTIKEAVAAGFKVLTENNLMKAAAKTTEQVFEEFIPQLAPGFIKGSDLTVSGNVYTAYKSLNDTVVVAYVNKGETKLLALVNASGVVTVYEAELVNEDTQEYKVNNVTADNSDVVTEVEALAADNTAKVTKLTNKVNAYYTNATDVTEIDINVYGSLVAAVSFTVEGETYYAYYSNSINGFGNHIMDIYVVLDSEGKVVKVDITTLFFEEEYFMTKPNITKDEYQNGFTGLDGETFDGSQAMMSGATMTSNATKQTMFDVFSQFASQGGNN